MTELPEGWAATDLGAVCKANYGKALRKDLRNESGRFAVYGSAGIAGNHDEPLVEGPVLIIGRKGNAGQVHFSGYPCWPIDTTYYLIPPSGLDAKFLAMQLQHLRLGQLDSSTAIPSLRREDLEGSRVVVPPLLEQRRIVAAIEGHFSRLDVAEAGLRRSRALTTVLDESAFDALIDEHWPTVAIGEVASVGSGSTPARSESRYWEGGHIPWVSSAAVNHHRITEPSALITDDALAETSVKLWPPGTVLVAMYGEGKTRGKAAVLEIEATCNQACAAIVPSDGVEAEYLRMVLTSQYEQNRKLASGGVQPNLNLGLIRAMRIPLPEVTTQRELVESAATSADSIERLKDSVTQAEQRSAALRRSILATAFSGQLVPQDLSDEPASVLLERIVAERATTKPTSRKKRAES